MNKRILLSLILILSSVTLISCKSQPDYPVELVNNERASAQLLDELKDFLKNDSTDEIPYRVEMDCWFYVEKLHNRAEHNKFKTALVIVTFEDGSMYALNAFDTVDCGTVYIDCAGPESWKDHYIPEDIYLYKRFRTEPYLRQIPYRFSANDCYDKVAYLQEGERMGFITIGCEQQEFDYSRYLRMKEERSSFEELIRELHSSIEQYNKNAPPPGYERELTTIEDIEGAVQEWSDFQSGYRWLESASTVKSIELLW